MMKSQLLLLASLVTATIAYSTAHITRQASNSTAKACSASAPCATGEICFNTKTKSTTEGFCIGSTCSETSKCPTGQYCGKRLIGYAGLLGADGPKFGSISHCIDMSLACGEDRVFPSCGCPSAMECIEGDWDRTGTASETVIDYAFCAPAAANWGEPNCVKTGDSSGEFCERTQRKSGLNVCVL
jgi:hypothetical protein